MTLEGMAITAVILGIPIALKLVPRGKHAQNINKKAYEYKLKINEIRKIKKKRAVENKLVREQYLSELHSKKREAEYFAEEYYGVWSGDLNQRQIEPFYDYYNNPTINSRYSLNEAEFRRKVELIQSIMPLNYPGCFLPEGCKSDIPYEITIQLIRGETYEMTLAMYPWLKIYDAFFNRGGFSSDDIKVFSDGSSVRMILDGNEIITREIIGDYGGLLEVITLKDCGRKDFKTMSYLNKIIAAYGHNAIVDDARTNKRYGRYVKKQIHYAEKHIPWRVKNAFQVDCGECEEEIEMLDWTGSAKIEVRMMNRYNHIEGCSIKSTFYMGDSHSLVGTMYSSDSYPIDNFDYYYKK